MRLLPIATTPSRSARVVWAGRSEPARGMPRAAPIPFSAPSRPSAAATERATLRTQARAAAWSVPAAVGPTRAAAALEARGPRGRERMAAQVKRRHNMAKAAAAARGAMVKAVLVPTAAPAAPACILRRFRVGATRTIPAISAAAAAGLIGLVSRPAAWAARAAVAKVGMGWVWSAKPTPAAVAAAPTMVVTAAVSRPATAARAS